MCVRIGHTEQDTIGWTEKDETGTEGERPRRQWINGGLEARKAQGQPGNVFVALVLKCACPRVWLPAFSPMLSVRYVSHVDSASKEDVLAHVTKVMMEGVDALADHGAMLSAQAHFDTQVLFMWCGRM